MRYSYPFRPRRSGRSRIIGFLVLLTMLGLVVWCTFVLYGVQTRVVQSPSASVSTLVVLSPTPDMSFLSQPRLDPAFINRVLSAYHSPAAGLGLQIYNLGRQYGVNTDLVLGMFGLESQFGTTGEARVTRSPGNLRCIDESYRQYQPTCADTYAWFPNWVNGFGAMIRLIKVGYIQGKVTGVSCPTLATAIPHWAPKADGGNPPVYISNVLTFLHAWYAGKVKP